MSTASKFQDAAHSPSAVSFKRKRPRSERIPLLFEPFDIQLAAIEHVDTDTYSLTFFNPDIDLSKIKRGIKGASETPRKIQRVERSVLNDREDSWWKNISVASSKAPGSFIDGNNNPTQISHLTAHGASGNAAELNNITFTSESAGVGIPVQPLDADVVPLETVASNLIENYLDSLYLSKASLAYFAKANLARARAAIGTDPLRQASLVTYVRSMILAHSSFDRKYRETLPETIDSLRTEVQHLERGLEERKPPRRKLKNFKKCKPGKNGLHTAESDYVRDWWRNQDISGGMAESGNLATTLQGELRLREIFLQIILIMEAMALEAALPPALDTQPATLTEAADLATRPSTIKKSKKPQNLEMALEMLVDRLCIWQSIEAVEDDKGDKENDRTEHSPQRLGPSASKDKLQEFCQHILIPFYAPRLRRKVEDLTKRMGASGSTAAQPMPSKKPAKLAPGTDLRGNRLSRTASSGSVQKRPPSLVRSATDSLVRGETCEKNSSPLDTSMKPPRRTLSRSSSVSSSTALSQREVDMTAIAKFSQSRARRHTNVENELSEAISILKRPNRGRAVEEYVNLLDTKKSTRAKKPWLKSRLSVEVGATPRKQMKTSDRMVGTATEEASSRPETFAIPSTNPAPLAINSSPHRAPGVADSTIRSRAGSGPPSHCNIHTPSREQLARHEPRPSASWASEDHRLVPNSTAKPSKTSAGVVGSTGSTVLERDIVPHSSPPQAIEDIKGTGIDLETPSKPRPVKSLPLASEDTPPALQQSIYASLGWDDDDVDELQ
ncbi:MAG: hypothetical protein Q9159_001525 [Coniocarpon cinnabarinum]